MPRSMCIGIAAAASDDGGGGESNHQDNSWMGPPEIQALVEKIPRVYSDLRWGRGLVSVSIVFAVARKDRSRMTARRTFLPGLHAFSVTDAQMAHKTNVLRLSCWLLQQANSFAAVVRCTKAIICLKRSRMDAYSWRSEPNASNARPSSCRTAAYRYYCCCALLAPDLGLCFCTSVSRRALQNGSLTYRTFPSGLRECLWRPLALLRCGACRTSCWRGKSIRGEHLLVSLFVFVGQVCFVL